MTAARFDKNIRQQLLLNKWAGSRSQAQENSNIKLQFVQLMIHAPLFSQEVMMFATLYDLPPVEYDDTVRMAYC